MTREQLAAVLYRYAQRDKLAPLIDFFSVGTNDLTQYTLACDRQNPALERFCDTHHEAVLRLIEFSAKNDHENGCMDRHLRRTGCGYDLNRDIPPNGYRRVVGFSSLRA